MCMIGMAEEFRDDGIAFNALWPRTIIATAAVQNLLGGEEAMARSRTARAGRRRGARHRHPSRAGSAPATSSWPRTCWPRRGSPTWPPTRTAPMRPSRSRTCSSTRRSSARRRAEHLRVTAAALEICGQRRLDDRDRHHAQPAVRGCSSRSPPAARCRSRIWPPVTGDRSTAGRTRNNSTWSCRTSRWSTRGSSARDSTAGRLKLP